MRDAYGGIPSVDYVMIACILTGITVCTFIDMQDVPQMSPANKSKTADRLWI